MGKKARKTRWRALAITGEHSDSEESNTHSGSNQIPKSYQHKQPFYSKFPYSSQSTPIRNRFQNDTKSTRSSSTNSENKITFNEDEYTRITTPRQDVLFKKGYLSKPKTYQTQTSTGNSTISTGNSTGNGTPDHQSADGTEGTDLEYESQFVFPNGFVDHNGIYYINSYEPYPPLVVYNAPFCYPEYPASRSKRYSTDSLTESTSPHNEETSQDMSQSGGETVNNISEFNPVFNVMVPSFYYNSNIPTPTDIEGLSTTEPRKIKKRRRRKLSKPIPDGSTTSDDYESDDAVSEIENRIIQGTHRPQTTSPVEEDTKVIPKIEEITDTTTTTDLKEEKQETSLKPDAKEFVPRAYRVDPNLHYIPNFIPLPPFDIPPNFNHAFIPQGIPINFIPPDHKFMPINFIPNYVPKHLETPQAEKTESDVKIEKLDKQPESVEEPAKVFTKNNIDIDKIVSKLEEAAKEQRFYESRKQKFSPKYKQKQKMSMRRQEVRKTSFNQEENVKKPEENGIKTVAEIVAPKNEEPKIVVSAEKPVVVVSLAPPVARIQTEDDKPQIKVNSIQVAKTIQEERPKPVQKTHKPQEHVKYNGVKPQTPKRNVNTVNNTENCSNARKNINLTPKRVEPPKSPQTPKGPNQWISVSRKKRKNKNQESEVDFEEEAVEEEAAIIATTTSNDGFETYDVNLLEDVVVQPSDNKPDVPEVDVIFQDVREVEKVLIEESKAPKNGESEEFDKLIKSLEEIEAKHAKKGKRPAQKTKRVIITDVDLSGQVEREKKTPAKVVKKVEAKKNDVKVADIKTIDVKIDEVKTVEVETIDKVEVKPVEVKTVEVVPDVKEVIKVADEIKVEEVKEIEVVETSEKKKNKNKKKKAPKMKPLSNSSSTATLSNADDSYDFLLHNSVLEDEKTNVEISEELDKIIQRGMYSSLQEKIKSLNIVAANDGFFKSVSMNTKSEKSSYLKTNDLGTVLKNTTNIFQQKRPSLDSTQKEFAQLADLQPTVSGSFLDVANVQKDPGIQKESLYPITQAVKEWMTKTRETTPEVELLKSPSTILKELRPKNGLDSRASSPGVAASSDDEVTIWSLTPEDNSVEEDLLDCWDDSGLETKQAKESSPETIETAEDVLEVYESKYGNNDDYNQLKAEADARKRSANFPKHANLPYKAICCSLM